MKEAKSDKKGESDRTSRSHTKRKKRVGKKGLKIIKPAHKPVEKPAQLVQGKKQNRLSKGGNSGGEAGARKAGGNATPGC